MGWERKRGKLDELNRLLRGDTHTTYTRHVGDPVGLVGIRFVITLDSDTQLPMRTAHRLIGMLAHPLNRALFDPETGRVIAGYTIVQPRVETSPSSSCRTWYVAWLGAFGSRRRRVGRAHLPAPQSDPSHAQRRGRGALPRRALCARGRRV